MIHEHLVLAAFGINIFAVMIFLIYAFIIALVIICLIRVAKYLSTAGKEQKLIRMELGKVAEEVHQLRKELKEANNNKPSEDS